MSRTAEKGRLPRELLKMDEIQIIDKLGLTDSIEITEITGKNKSGVMRILSKLTKRGEINMIIFKSSKTRRRVYLNDELYNCLC